MQCLPVSYWDWFQANHLMSTGSQNSWKCNIWLPCPGKCQLQNASSHYGARLVRVQENSTFQFIFISIRVQPGDWLGNVETGYNCASLWYPRHVTSPGYPGHVTSPGWVLGTERSLLHLALQEWIPMKWWSPGWALCLKRSIKEKSKRWGSLRPSVCHHWPSSRDQY